MQSFTKFASKRLRSLFLAGIAICFIFILFAGSCGQPLPPTGGPRDTLPPVLVRADPAGFTTNFKGNRINIEFNEYIQLDNPFEKLEYSPVPKVKPQAEGKLRNVVIRIKDTLEPNTTYSIDFGDAIKDINENNALRDFKYVFSTGPTIDSGVITGRVYYAETGKTDSLITVILHRNPDDSAVAKEKPRYTTRTKSNGDFTFRYLASGTYRIFALKDADGGLKFDQKSEYLGFFDSAVTANQPNAITLYAFTEEPDVQKKTPTGSGPAPTARNKDDKRLRFATSLEAEKQDILNDLILTFESKLKSFDTSRISLTGEDFKPLMPFHVQPDSTMKKLTLSHRWLEGSKYRLIISKDFAMDTAGNYTTRTDTIKFETKKESDYGSLNVRVTNLDTTSRPVLLIYKDERLERTEPLLRNRYQYKLFRPGEYEFRILFDRNRNGKWDTGNYWKKLQPERIVPGKQKLNIRAGWDNELEINLREMGN